jgi:type I restriction enzyme M protein
MDDTVDWAVRIKALRIALHLTQAQLAERIGASRRSVIDWEGGKRVPDRMARLALLAAEAGLAA